jgi:hypothetical protein
MGLLELFMLGCLFFAFMNATRQISTWDQGAKGTTNE